MEEINIKDLFTYFISKIFIVVIAFIIMLSASLVYSNFIKVPKYNSYTTIVLTHSGDSTNSESNSGITQNDITLNQKLVPTYREIIKSRRVLGPVIENLNLDMTVSELSSNVSVTNPDSTELIKITVSSVNKEEARDITNEIAKVFSEEIHKIFVINNVSVIDAAIESNHPYNMNILKDAIIASAVGIVIGLGIIFVMFYFDTTIKNPDEIQTKLGLPLLGVVARVDNVKGKKLRRIKKGTRRGN